MRLLNQRLVLIRDGRNCFQADRDNSRILTIVFDRGGILSKKGWQEVFFATRKLQKYMARPKLNDGEKREIDVSVALNAREFEIISTKAKLSGNRIAVFLRRAALDDKTLKIVPEVNRAVAAQLREMQHLLGQFSTLLEQQQINVVDPIFFIEMQKELRQMHSDFLNLCRQPK